MTQQVKAIDLVDGEMYTLVGPVEGVTGGKQGVADILIEVPHRLMSSENGMLRFLMNSDENNSSNNYSNSNNNNNFSRRAPGPRFLEIYTGDLPNGDDQLFETVQLSVRNAVEEKAARQVVANVYEIKTNTSAANGEGPGKMIRELLGIKPMPKGGSKRSSKRSSKRTRRNKRKSKKTRKSRK